MAAADAGRAAREELARRAARVMLEHPGLDVDSALRKAPRGGLADHGGPPPGRGLVHRHLEAMLQELLGEAAFEAGRLDRLRAILEVLDLLDYLAAPNGIDVAGRTARGYLVGPVLVFGRLYEGRALEPLAGELEANGIEEVRCLTAHTRLGPRPRLLFDSDGIRFSLTDCPRMAHADRERDLFTGKPIPVVSLDALRKLVEEGFSRGRP